MFIILITLIFTSVFSVAFSGNANKDFLNIFGEPLKEKVPSVIFPGFMTYADERLHIFRWRSLAPSLRMHKKVTNVKEYCEAECQFTNYPISDYDVCVATWYDRYLKNGMTDEEAMDSSMSLWTQLSMNEIPITLAIYGYGMFGTEKEVVFSKEEIDDFTDVYIPVYLEAYRKKYPTETDEELASLLHLKFDGTIIEDHIKEQGNINFTDDVRNTELYNFIVEDIRNPDFVQEFGNPLEKKVPSVIFSKSGFTTYAKEDLLVQEWNNIKAPLEILKKVKNIEEYCDVSCVLKSNSGVDCKNICIESNDWDGDEVSTVVSKRALSDWVRLSATAIPKLIAMYGFGVFHTVIEIQFSKDDLNTIGSLYIPEFLKLLKQIYGDDYDEEKLIYDYGLNFEGTILGPHIADKSNVAGLVDAVRKSEIFTTIFKKEEDEKNEKLPKNQINKPFSMGAIIGIAIACVIIILAILIPVLLVLKKKGKICKKQFYTALNEVAN